MSDTRYSILRKVYSLQPFNITGDATIGHKSSLAISCIIPTFDRWHELDNILCCLSLQDFPTDRFEVIVIEDGASEEGKACCATYQSCLDICLLQTDSVQHCVGALRNKALSISRGEYLLFLDDDTTILQVNFLQALYDRFTALPEIDCLQISGRADRCLLKNRYSYLDKFSFATRCVAYRRDRLILIGGFIDSLKSYEDIEMSIRFIISGGKVSQEETLYYYHPPLYFQSTGKTITNGLSFLTLFSRYGLLLWIVCYLNAIRFLPLFFSPIVRQRQWGKISAGFLIAPFYRLFKSSNVFYR
jgi:glycosyltransferase involved in cell wall biosynthesis